ncbi:MAG TPA: transglycosylase domain-containing protein [Bacteroidales bacterium]|nr:transglycosylase domain-containing protein [Bacteroidales bacterium]
MLKDIVARIKQGYTQLSAKWQVIWSRIKPWLQSIKEVWRKSRWYLKILYSIIGSFILFIFLLFLININFLWLFGKSPRISEIRNPQQSIASEVYSADGKMIGRFFRENRTPVELRDLSPMLLKTLVATEDERFYSHMGIDFRGLFSAFYDWFSGNYRGASTISQQLIKNMYKSRTAYSRGLLGHIPYVRLVIMKLKEWIGALKIEVYYSKEEILVMYLNTVDFGNNTFGIKTASRVYFSTTPDKLKPAQIAMLVGMLKAPTTYNPLRNPKNCNKRRNVVLGIMKREHLITESSYDTLKKRPLGLTYKVDDLSDGQAPYFRMAVADAISDWCRENNLDVYTSGLKIYTTLDSRMQRYAEESVKKQMKILQSEFNRQWGRENPWRDANYREIPDFIRNNAMECPRYKAFRRQTGNGDSAMALMEKPISMKLYDLRKGAIDTVLSPMDSIRYVKRLLRIGFVAVEPENRYVRAWVGDLDYRFFKYDHVSQAQRQPGSTFKLFVYTAAIASGLSPCDMRRDAYVEWRYREKGQEKIWRPHNVNGVFYNIPVSLRSAFTNSINGIAVTLAKEVGIMKVIEYAYRLGIRTKLEVVPSVCLGSGEVKLLDLVNSYASVIADGMYEAPVLVTRIEDRNGKVLWKYKPLRKQAIDYETAFLMQEMLKAGVKERGSTVQNLWSYDIFRYGTELGGKTGTSSNHSDMWFVGVSPALVAGAWVGGEQRSIHFRPGTRIGEGGHAALPVFGYFMEKVMKDESLKAYRQKFPGPKEKISKNYNCVTSIPDSILRAVDSMMHRKDSLPADKP